MSNHLNDLIASKFELFTKFDILNTKLPKMIEELNERQNLLSDELGRTKDLYFEQIQNKERESESFSRELKRMQIVNRELITEFNSSSKGIRDHCKSMQCNPHTRVHNFLTKDCKSVEENDSKNQLASTHYSRSHERPVQSACNQFRRKRGDPDYATSKGLDLTKRSENQAQTAKLKRLELKFKNNSYDYETTSLQSVDSGVKTFDRRGKASLRISTAINSINEATQRQSVENRRRYGSKSGFSKYRTKQKTPLSKGKSK